MLPNFRRGFLKRLTLLAALVAAAMVGHTAFAVTFTVTNLNNDGPGSFRKALNDARVDDTINFAVTGTIIVNALSLSTAATNLVIQGPGANLLSVSGNGTARVFFFSESSVTMSGLTIRDGNSRLQSFGNIRGGGIYNEGRLTLNDCVIINNQGGGIDSAGPLEINRCTIANNTTISRSMQQPVGTSLAAGLSVLATGTTATISNSTIVDNEAINQEFTDPDGAVRAGGISISGQNSQVRIIGCTVARNRISGSSAFPGAGGVTILPTSALPLVTDTIIAGNIFASAPDCAGPFDSGGYNLIGNQAGSIGFTHAMNHDQVGGGERPVIDPRLGALSNNGGRTLTMPPLSDSPAIDQGLSSLPIDQRGANRRFDFADVPNAEGGDGSDVGAFEFGSSVPGLVPVDVVSRKTHVNAGPFDLSLATAGTAAVESRTGGSGNNHTIIFTFSNALSSVGSAAVTAGTGMVSSSGIGSGDARQYIVNLTGVTDAQRITVTLSNVTDSLGNSSSSVGVTMGVLLGDSNGDSFVNSGDATQTRSRSGQATDATNFRSDFNVDGTINGGDAIIARTRSGNSLP